MRFQDISGKAALILRLAGLIPTELFLLSVRTALSAAVLLGHDPYPLLEVYFKTEKAVKE